VSVELAGVAQSTWSFHRLRLFVPKLSSRFGVPAGGKPEPPVPRVEEVPSRSEGNSPPTLELNWKHYWVAAAPASMLVRSKAHTFEPANVWPLLKVL
jgi:hypothetical protein